jgi:hypothetical protein
MLFDNVERRFAKVRPVAGACQGLFLARSGRGLPRPAVETLIERTCAPGSAAAEEADMADRQAGIPGSVRVIGILIMVAGGILLVAGAATWFVVQDQLADEQITVSDDADRFAGDDVDGPLTAYSEAQTIEKHALEASGGQTYAQLPQDDPTRQTVMTASFLRASLFTSVVAFGVAAMAAGLGIVFLLLGWALLGIYRGGNAPAAAG